MKLLCGNAGVGQNVDGGVGSVLDTSPVRIAVSQRVPTIVNCKTLSGEARPFAGDLASRSWLIEPPRITGHGMEAP